MKNHDNIDTHDDVCTPGIAEMPGDVRWGVLFDLDGVLIDSEHEYTSIWERINREFPTDVPNFAERIKGTTLENILATHYPDPETRKRVEARLLEEEAKMVYTYLPGAKELLDDLKRHNVPTALFTSSNGIKMAHLYKDLPDIRQYFRAIITGDMVRHSKPDPEGYLMAAKSLGLTDGHWVVVEDSLQGVKAGEASGGAVLGVAGTLPPLTLAPHSDEVTDTLQGVTAESLRKLIKT